MLKALKKKRSNNASVKIKDDKFYITSSRDLDLEVAIKEICKFTFNSKDYFFEDTYILEGANLKIAISSEAEGANAVWQFFLNLPETNTENARKAIQCPGNGEYIIWEENR